MAIANLAAWSQVAASIAVLITLIYVAIELRQNTMTMRAQTRQSMVDLGQQALFKQIEYPDIFISMAQPGNEISAEEKVRFDGWLRALMRGREFDWLQYRNGLLDKTTFDSYSMIIPILLATTRGSKWWERAGRPTVHPEFGEFVDGLLRDHPNTDHLFTNVLALD